MNKNAVRVTKNMYECALCHSALQIVIATPVLVANWFFSVLLLPLVAVIHGYTYTSILFHTVSFCYVAHNYFFLFLWFFKLPWQNLCATCFGFTVLLFLGLHVFLILVCYNFMANSVAATFAKFFSFDI